MSMRFSLQDMVRNTLAQAEERTKIAQLQQEPDRDESKKKEEEKRDSSDKSAPKETGNTPERNYESYGEKTSSVFVEKLASAVEYLNAHFVKEAVGEAEPPLSHSTPEPTIGPGIGQTSLETNVKSPTPGMQSTDTGEAKTGKPPLDPPTDKKAPGQTNPGTALETDQTTPPGGSEDWTHQDKMKQSAALMEYRKKKTAQIHRVAGIITKMAGDDESSAQIKGSHNDVPPPATKSEEDVPKLPGEASKQESLINSNEAARDYTKQQAKAVPKERMGEVIDEPAQKKSTDPVLQNNLDATSGAGVKISSVEQAVAARALLQKIAEEGAKPDASPEEKERAEKLHEALKAKQEEKKEAGFGRGAMPISGGY